MDVLEFIRILLEEQREFSVYYPTKTSVGILLEPDQVNNEILKTLTTVPQGVVYGFTNEGLRVIFAALDKGTGV